MPASKNIQSGFSLVELMVADDFGCWPAWVGRIADYGHEG